MAKKYAFCQCSHQRNRKPGYRSQALPLFEQLEAVATSVPMNIAEGKGRYSRKEFIHFLHIARGSLFETMTLIELFEMRNWVKPETTQSIYTQADEIGKMINGLIKSLADSS